MSTTYTAVGAATTANNLTTAHQTAPRITALGGDRFLTVWMTGDTTQDGSFTAIKGRIFTGAGVPVGGEFRVNTAGVGDQQDPAVAKLSDGRFVVTWDTSDGTQDGNYSAVKAQIFDANGTKLGSEFVVNTLTINDQYRPTITALASGGFVIGWETAAPAPGGTYNDVHAQIFDNTGAKSGSEFLVNTNTYDPQMWASFTTLANGGFVATWQSGLTGHTVIRAQVYTAAGAKVGSEFAVNTLVIGSQYGARTAGLADGRFVVTWETADTTQDGSGTAVKAQIFEANGVKVGSEFLVNTVTAGNQGTPSVASLADGTFILSWANETTANPANGAVTAIRAQIFDSSGARIGSEFVVQNDVANLEVNPSIVGLSGGGFAVAWETRPTAVSNYDIGLRVYDSNAAPELGAASISLSVAENQATVATLSAFDFDGDTVTYSIIGGADAALFSINATTGALRFLNAQNYESPADSGANNIYDVIVQASDGSLADTQAIAVTVTNVNEPLVITSNGGGDVAVLSISENATAVATVTSADPDGTTATYAITGGADAALFTINAATGVLAFISAPNFEAPTDAGANNVYDVIVSASDGVFTDSQAIAVTVTNINEGLSFTSGTAFGVAENSTAVATVSATDLDADAVSYAIAGGADAALFAIDAATGILSFVAAPDFEAPGDAGGNNVYDVIVQASDGSLTNSQAIAVTVSDVNEAPAPEYLVGTYGNDVILGHDGDDWIDGGYGNDTLDGRGGNDTLYGRDDNDKLYGRSGNDMLDGGNGNDILDGGDGNDVLIGGNGYNILIGGAGADVLDGRADYAVNTASYTNATSGVSLSLVSGGTGGEAAGDTFFNIYEVDGSAYADQIEGDDLANSLMGGTGDDVLSGLDGDDYLSGGLGADTLYGGDGNDIAYAYEDDGAVDHVYGGAGNDIVMGNTGDVIDGGAGDDQLRVNGNDGVYQGGDGDDTIAFWATGTTGTHIDGGAGYDVLDISYNSLTIASIVGIEQIVASDYSGSPSTITVTSTLDLSAATFSGYLDLTAAWSSSPVTIIGPSGPVGTGGSLLRLSGAAGNDSLTGSSGNDEIWGNMGDDALTGRAGDDYLSGGDGNDIAIFSGTMASYSIATSGGSIVITDNAPTIDGNDGTDTLSGIETAQFQDGSVGIAAPIILDLDGNGVHTVDLSQSTARFDWTGDGHNEATSWVGQGDGFLVYDRNGDGMVSGANELSFVADKANAASDLDGLRAFDSNGDGQFSGLDDKWSSFDVWTDGNGNGLVDQGEFLSLGALGIASISLAGTSVDRAWNWGQAMTVNTGSFTLTDGTVRAFGDVALGYAHDSFGSGLLGGGPAIVPISDLADGEALASGGLLADLRAPLPQELPAPGYADSWTSFAVVSNDDAQNLADRHDLAKHDVLQFDKDIFSDWAHLLGATQPQGSDLLIALDAADTVTLDAADTMTLENVALAHFAWADATFV